MAALSPTQALKAMEAMSGETKEDPESKATPDTKDVSLGEKKSHMDGLSLFCDEMKENTTLANIVDIALLEIDPKSGREILNRSKKWTIHNSKKNNIDIIYRKMENSKNITLRSSMDINVSINEIYEFFRCDVNDDLELALEIDKMFESYRVSKVYDKDRCVVHSAFTTGIPKSLVKPRDFCWMKRRFKYDNCMCCICVLYCIVLYLYCSVCNYQKRFLFVYPLYTCLCLCFVLFCFFWERCSWFTTNKQ